jgi:hypothetical protein
MTPEQIIDLSIDDALWREELALDDFLTEPTDSHREAWQQARSTVDQLARI